MCKRTLNQLFRVEFMIEEKKLNPKSVNGLTKASIPDMINTLIKSKSSKL